MTEATAAPNVSERLFQLARRLERQEGFARVVESLGQGHAATLDGAWGSSCALVAAALADHGPGTLLIVLPQAADIDKMVDDLEVFTRLVPARFPAWESLPSDRIVYDDVFGDRMRVLKSLGGDATPRLVVTSIQSLLQPVADREALHRRSRTFRTGQQVAQDDLAAWLVEGGFHNTPAVELPGEFSIRGGIVDLFAPDAVGPVRIELFGDEIESIRSFDLGSQRSLETLDSVEITLVESGTRDRAHLSDHLPAGSWAMLIEPALLEKSGQDYLGRIERPDNFHAVSDVLRELLRLPTLSAASVAAGTLDATARLPIESVEHFSGDIKRVRDELDEVGADSQMFVVCQTEAESRRLADVFGDTTLAAGGRLHFALGTLSGGFRLVSEGIVLLSSGELFGRADLARRTRRRHLGRAIDSFMELREGDLVVHLAHGIARYRGMKLLEKNGHVEEHLALQFHGGTRLYVPSSKISLVQKYVGSTKGRPTLARLGGATWSRQKQRVQKAVTDLAAEMLQLQAERASRPGIAFAGSTEWQREFDASFPYQETDDQMAAIESIRADMAQPRPMDRLLCGDVGYGKTELAMRAAFRAVDAGYQVAVLVPTTILAAQHYHTFGQRMAEFPFNIAMLSRFCARGEQNQILRRMAEGSVDIVIGTHRLAQADVRFHNLGLVVIDEEQRFGVEIKERLKAYRHVVDVLTMTATPIPRTLHMGLLGVRDISNLETPPEDRLAVETHVGRFHPELIRHAVLRELARGGQIFFVHNRVQDIHTLAKRLHQIVPEARLAVAHGQMPEGELERVMVDFVNHEFDLLLATTIVESGLDIPNANTIFIDEADRYGLADLHQLRGRVGRYKHRAYCYLLVDPNKNISPNAAKRLHAIEEFSEMGAGFAISMRDLEIRGAGNILGTQQSGHIAVVGYELYCTLLEQAVRRLKRLPPKVSIDVEVDLPIEAHLPRDYVADMRLKIDLYRRLARVSQRRELEDFTAELSDRFGPPPPAAQRLLALAALRIAAHGWQIDSIHLEDGYVVFGYTSADRIRQLKAQMGGKLRVVDQRSAYLPMGKGVAQPDAILRLVESVLRPT